MLYKRLRMNLKSLKPINTHDICSPSLINYFICFSQTMLQCHHSLAWIWIPKRSQILVRLWQFFPFLPYWLDRHLSYLAYCICTKDVTHFAKHSTLVCILKIQHLVLIMVKWKCVDSHNWPHLVNTTKFMLILRFVVTFILSW